MNDKVIIIDEDCFVELDEKDSYININEMFNNIPDIAKPLINIAERSLSKIEKWIYTAPAFINLIKSSVPEYTFKAILSDEQKRKIANGAIKIMAKKDGSLLANLVDVKTNKIVSNISLEKLKVSPDVETEMTNFATQIQMAQISEQIQSVKESIEDVRQGQENDRLATAYSCQQKLLQAMEITNPDLKQMALLRIASDAEDSRNLLMLSQNVNVSFIKEQPDSIFQKLISNTKKGKVDSKINEIRESLNALNIVSLVEATAYQEMNETDSAMVSLKYYADYLNKTYLDVDGFVEKLDMMDPSPANYWSKTLPIIEEKIKKLPCNKMHILKEEN